MSEFKERGDVEQALNELYEMTRLGLDQGIKSAHKRLDALGVSVKRRAAKIRSLDADEASEAEPKKSAPIQRKAPGPDSEV